MTTYFFKGNVEKRQFFRMPTYFFERKCWKKTICPYITTCFLKTFLKKDRFAYTTTFFHGNFFDKKTIVNDNNFEWLQLGAWGTGAYNMGAWGPNYASEIKKNKKMKKVPNRLQMAPFDVLIKPKCHLNYFLTFWENIFLRQKMITGGPRPRPRHHWWCIKTPRTSPDVPEKKLKIEIFVDIFDVYDRLWWSSKMIV